MKLFLTLWVFSLMVLGLPGHGVAAKESDWRTACDQLVKNIVAPSGIENSRILEVMRNTPRHLFVPVAQREYAYYDMALPIGGGQTISPPFIVATMTQAIDPQPTDKVLEIGTGSGYQAAILSPLVTDVYTIEIVESLGVRAKKTLQKLNYKNIHTKIGDGFLGWASQSPFDKIIVTCSPEKVPPALIQQLREGGQMVVPVGERYQQTLFLMKKTNGKLVADALEPTFFVPMTGQAEQLRDQRYDASRPQLVQGSFEQSEKDALSELGDPQMKGWYYLRQGRIFTDLTAPDGEHVLRFTNSTPGRDAQVLQAFGIDGQAVHQLDIALWVKASQLRPGRSKRETAHLEINFFDHRRAPIRREVMGPWQGTWSWEKKQQTVRVPSQARLAVLAVGMFGSVGQLSVDAIQLQGHDVLSQPGLP